jgi:hypothetical protein
LRANGIEKWGGKLPQVAGGGQYILDVESLLEKSGG